MSKTLPTSGGAAEGWVSIPVGNYKKWMLKHDYNLRHGKNMPTQAEAGSLKRDPPAPAK